MVSGKCFLALFLLISFFSIKGADQPSCLRRMITFVPNKIRDGGIEAIIRTFYIFNSDTVVEADETNYPQIDKIVSQLAKKTGIAKPLVFIFTKKYSSLGFKLNAFTTGDGGRSVIFIGSELMRKFTLQELEGILAHEITHVQKNHIWKRIIFNCVSGGIIGYLMYKLNSYLTGNSRSFFESCGKLK